MLLYFSEQGIGEGTFLSSLESCCWFFFVCCWVHLLDNVRVYCFSFFIKRIEVLKYRNNNIEIRFSRANKFNSFFYSWQLLTKISNYVPLSHDLGEKKCAILDISCNTRDIWGIDFFGTITSRACNNTAPECAISLMLHVTGRSRDAIRPKPSF